MRAKGGKLVIRYDKAVLVLIRKPRYQVHMGVDIAHFQQLFHIVEHRIYVFFPVYGSQSFRIAGLDSDFKLEQSGSCLSEKIQCGLIQQVRTDLKVEVGNTVVIFHQIAENLAGALFIVVKRSVDEFHLLFSDGEVVAHP